MEALNGRIFARSVFPTHRHLYSILFAQYSCRNIFLKIFPQNLFFCSFGMLFKCLSLFCHNKNLLWYYYTIRGFVFFCEPNGDHFILPSFFIFDSTFKFCFIGAFACQNLLSRSPHITVLPTNPNFPFSPLSQMFFGKAH